MYIYTASLVDRCSSLYKYKTLGLVAVLRVPFGSPPLIFVVDDGYDVDRQRVPLCRFLLLSISGWQYREWLPSAKAVYVFGDFNHWDRTSHPLHRERRGVPPYYFETSLGSLKGVKDDKSAKTDREETSSVWSIFLPDRPDGTPVLTHR